MQQTQPSQPVQPTRQPTRQPTGQPTRPGHDEGEDLHVRAATREDHADMRAVLRAAYAPYAPHLGPELFARYLADLLDLETHAAHGQLLVAEDHGRIVGTAAFYPDSFVQGFGWPPGWAGGRALSVHPDARGRGAAQALLAHVETLARLAGSRVFAFHTAEFMVDAVALYEHLGFRRAPDFDTDLGAHYGIRTDRSVVLIAYRRDLSASPSWSDSGRKVRGSGPIPGYYYGRPASLIRERLSRKRVPRDPESGPELSCQRRPAG
jgi:GNAT superfamily N-acetyltransferase